MTVLLSSLTFMLLLITVLKMGIPLSETTNNKRHSSHDRILDRHIISCFVSLSSGKRNKIPQPPSPECISLQTGISHDTSTHRYYLFMMFPFLVDTSIIFYGWITNPQSLP